MYQVDKACIPKLFCTPNFYATFSNISKEIITNNTKLYKQILHFTCLNLKVLLKLIIKFYMCLHKYPGEGSWETVFNTTFVFLELFLSLASGKCKKNCKKKRKKNRVILVKGSCPITNETAPFPVGYRLNFFPLRS